MVKKINFICYGIIFPSIISFIAYFGFGSKHTDYSQRNGLLDIYYHDVYIPRFLSRDLLMWFYRFSTPYIETMKTHFKSMEKVGTDFFFTIFIYNTIFYILLSIVLFKMFFCGNNTWNRKYSALFYVFLVLLVGLSQYVPTPYDNVSNFLFLVSVMFIFKLKERFSFKNNIILTCIVIVSTCNRESSALILSFYATVILSDSIRQIFEKETFRKLLKHLWLPVLAFLLTYFGLRLNLQNNNVKTVEDNYILTNLTKIQSIVGLLCYVVFTHLSFYLAETAKQKQNVKNFMFFSFPYIFTILYAGIWWEVRLFIPLLLGQFILANHAVLLRNKSAIL
jgi:hypothetical protein